MEPRARFAGAAAQLASKSRSSRATPQRAVRSGTDERCGSLPEMEVGVSRQGGGSPPRNLWVALSGPLVGRFARARSAAPPFAGEGGLELKLGTPGIAKARRSDSCERVPRTAKSGVPIPAKRTFRNVKFQRKPDRVRLPQKSAKPNSISSTKPQELERPRRLRQNFRNGSPRSRPEGEPPGMPFPKFALRACTALPNR